MTAVRRRFSSNQITIRPPRCQYPNRAASPAVRHHPARVTGPSGRITILEPKRMLRDPRWQRAAEQAS